MPTMINGPVEQPHRRFNILTGSWVQVSPNRNQRPWKGGLEALPRPARPEYDPGCYLCPGNRRAAGESNPEYAGTFAFDNDFPALVPQATGSRSEIGLLVSETESGLCRVLCFSPRHDLTLAELDVGQLRAVVDLWVSEYRTLGARPDINHVQIFENKGEVMGCSNPHPHGQVWAQRSIPDEPARELRNMGEHFRRTGSPLLMDYLEQELHQGGRVVCRNAGFVALVPFWAVWPFETLVLPRRQRASLLDLDHEERDQLADILGRVTRCYDRVFGVPFPYSAGIHQAPTDGDRHDYCTLHVHFFPPLLRSATVKKFMVGYEMLAGPQRDLTAETAAELLRELASRDPVP